MYKFNDFTITKREILFSVIILCLVLCLGIVINNKIDNHFTLEEEKYTKAYKTNDDEESFAYAINTNVGNLINYGKFEVVDPVKDEWLKDGYMAYEKITERYTRHHRTVCTNDSKGKEHCHQETYYSWDYIDSQKEYANEIYLSGVKFPLSRFVGYPWQILDLNKDNINTEVGTISGMYLYEGYSVGSLRHYYRIVSTEFYATTFGIAKDNSYYSENDEKIRINNETLEEYVENSKGNKTLFKIGFWIFHLILWGIAIFMFYYLENDWLERSKNI